MRRSMTMIGDRLNVAVHVRVEVLASLALIDPAWNDVKQVRYDAGGDEELPFGVVFDSPRIAESVRNHFEYILRRVVAPHAAIDLDTLAGQHILGKRFIAIVKTAPADRFSDL